MLFSKCFNEISLYTGFFIGHTVLSTNGCRRTNNMVIKVTVKSGKSQSQGSKPNSILQRFSIEHLQLYDIPSIGTTDLLRSI